MPKGRAWNRDRNQPYAPRQSPQHLQRRQQNEPVTECDRILSVLPRLGGLPTLSDQMVYVYDNLSLKESDHQTRLDFIRKLEIECNNILGRQVRCCYLYAFGSTVNRLGMQNCDLDLVLTTNGEIHRDWPGLLPDCKMLINAIKRLLYREQNNFGISGIVPITSARIPLIKFRYNPTDINCDLSFNRRMGVINSKLIAHVMEFSESAKWLAFTVRLWGKQKNFVGGGGFKINSYSITLIVIFYLQTKGVLPALERLKHSANTIRGSGEEGDSFYTHISDFDQFRGTTKHFRQDELLQGFLEFYIRFPFEKLIISVLRGRYLTLSECPNFNMKEINVQDPYETLYNTAKGVQPSLMNWLRKCLVDAWLHRSLLCYPNHRGEPWGLQYLLQQAEGPKQTKGQRKHKRNSQSPSAAPSLVTDHGSGPCITLVLPIPYNESCRPTSTYSRVCSLITRTLQDLYGMTLEIPPKNHPLVDILQPLSSPGKKRVQHAAFEDEAKRQRVGAPSTYPSGSKDRGTDGDFSNYVSPNRGYTGHDTEPTSGRVNLATASSTADSTSTLPIEFYLPYTIQATTKCKSLRNFLVLQDKILDYKTYARKVKESLSSEHGLQGQKFTLTFQPHKARFDSLDLEIQDINTHYVDIIGQHLGILLPIVFDNELRI